MTVSIKEYSSILILRYDSEQTRGRTPQRRLPSSKSSEDGSNLPFSNRSSIQRSVTPVRFRPEPSFSIGSSNLKPSGGIEFNESE